MRSCGTVGVVVAIFGQQDLQSDSAHPILKDIDGVIT